MFGFLYYIYIIFSFQLMANLKCIIHYEYENKTCSKIKHIFDVNWKRINAAKEIRISKGGSNHHKEQCDLVPDSIDPEIHGIHMEPCYKKFTLINAQESTIKKRSPAEIAKTSLKRPHLRGDSNTSSKKKQLKTEPINKNVYPKDCQYCQKYQLKSSNTVVLPYKCLTKSAEKTIKDAAKQNNEDLYNEIKDLDLIAKEFGYHNKCYKKFTKIKTSSQELEPRVKSKLETVIDHIKENIIDNNEAISMTVLHDLYGGNQDTKNRNRLKGKIKEQFSDQLLFFPVDGKTSEVVIKSGSLKLPDIPNNRDQIIKKAADILCEDIQEYEQNIPKMSWPPYIEELSTELRRLPESLTTFFSDF